MSCITFIKINPHNLFKLLNSFIKRDVHYIIYVQHTLKAPLNGLTKWLSDKSKNRKL